MRFGGYGLSGLAFALVLASPPVASRRLSARTSWRSPSSVSAFMSPRFASIAIRRSSTWPSAPSSPAAWAPSTFLAERLHAIEEAVRQLLGYPHRLPIPFRAILGLFPTRSSRLITLVRQALG